MESMFQTVVSDFDLNVFDQTANVNQAPQEAICDLSQMKSCILKMKRRICNTNRLLTDLNQMKECVKQKSEIIERITEEKNEITTLYLKDNEKIKFMNDERNTYFNKMTEYSNMCQILESNEKKHLEEIVNLKFTIKLIENLNKGQVDQGKVWQTERDDIEKTLKQAQKESQQFQRDSQKFQKKSQQLQTELKQSYAKLAVLEKQCSSVSKDLVLSNKKPKKWLEITPESHKQHKIEKADETDEYQDETDLDHEVPSTPAIVYNSTSLDYDHIGSVDTGLGSVSERSEKSFNSPNYNIHYSPPFVSSILCNKCDIPKSDVSTSPISPGRSGFGDNSNVCQRCALKTQKDSCTSPIPLQGPDTADNSATIICQRCASRKQKDSCTSPIPLQRIDTDTTPIPLQRIDTATSPTPLQIIDTATNTDISYKICTQEKKFTSNAQENNSNIEQTHMTIGKISYKTRTPEKVESVSGYNEISVSMKSSFTAPRKLEDFSFDTDDECDGIVSNGSTIASPFEELNTSSPGYFDKFVPKSQIITSKDTPTAAVKTQNNIGLESNSSNECVGHIQSHVNDPPIIIPHDFDAALTIQLDKQALTDSIEESVKLPPTSPAKLWHRTPDIGINIKKKTQQELDCLELNNSNNSSYDDVYDSEIQKIFDKMRLPHPMLTPIPATPFGGKLLTPRLPIENLKTFNEQWRQLIVKVSKEYNNIEMTTQNKTRLKETFHRMSEIYIDNLFHHVDLSEQNLHDLNFNPDKVVPLVDRSTYQSFHERSPKLPLYIAHTEANNRQKSEVEEPIARGHFLCNGCTVVEEDPEVENQISNGASSIVQHDGSSHVIKNRIMSNSNLLKGKISDVVSSQCGEVSTNNNFSHDSSWENVYHNNTQLNVDNSNTATTSNAIGSRNSIVYEDLDISDDDNNTLLSELYNSTKDHNENPDIVNSKRKGKLKKITKLEKLRLQCLPNRKIKKDNTKFVAKLHSKSVPKNYVPKKKATKSDSAATLNEKSIYENAVKVIASLKASKEPIIILKDCAIYKKDEYKTVEKIEKIERSSNSQSSANLNNINNDNWKLSENLTNMPDIHSSDSIEISGFHVTKINRRTDTQNKYNKTSNTQLSTEINTKKKNKRNLSAKPENIDSIQSPVVKDTKIGKITGTYLDATSDKSLKIIKQKANIASQKLSDTNILIPKCTHEVVHSSDSIETKDPKQRRTRNSKSNDNVMESDSPRILRSNIVKPKHLTNMPESHNFNSIDSSVFKYTKIGKIPSTYLDPTSDKSQKIIKHKANIIASQKQSDANILIPKRTLEVVHTSDSNETKEPKRRKTSNSNSNDISMGPESPKILCSNTVEPDSPRVLRSSHVKHNTKTGSEGSSIIAQSSEILHLIVDQNKPKSPITHENTLTLDRKSRIARQNIHQDSKIMQVEPKNSTTEISRKNTSGTISYDRSSESMQVEQSNSTSEISGKNSNRTLSYADIDLFSVKDTQDDTTDSNKVKKDVRTTILSPGKKHRTARQNANRGSESADNGSAASSADLNLFSTEDTQDQMEAADIGVSCICPKDSLLCRMIEKYGVQRVKFIAKQAPEGQVDEVCRKLEAGLSEIIEVPTEEYLDAATRLVRKIQTWDVKHFMFGLIKFLKDPDRKNELYNKMLSPLYPPMTRKEQALLYVLEELEKSSNYRNIVQKILLQIEYTLLGLNKTAESYYVMETMSHFYALLCRNYQKLSQLRLFILSAMYCLRFKSVILVQQCLEVWMNVLPIGHTGNAKCPLVLCLVYLLYFCKKDDKYNRGQEIKNTLFKKYNYDMSEWTEIKILDMFRTAIIEIRDSTMARAELRLSLLILAKRNSPKWCHTNIIKNMLQPLIDDSSTSDRTKRFCASMLGPLLKPYPCDMKVHKEIVIKYLMEMLHSEKSPEMQEAIISSLICVDENNNRFYQFLSKWSPKQVSPELHLLFRDYVTSKRVQIWKQILSTKIS